MSEDRTIIETPPGKASPTQRPASRGAARRAPQEGDEEPVDRGDNATPTGGEASRLAALLHGRKTPPWGFSLLMHSMVLLALALVGRPLGSERTDRVTIDTRLSPEREQVEFPEWLDEQEVPAESLQIAPATGAPSDVVGSSRAIQQARVDRSRLPEAELKINVAPISLPDQKILGENIRLGLDGDIGAPVGDYGAALDRLSHELLRLLSESGKVLVIWLFDESGSMSDDQQQIKQRMDRVYRELGLVDETHGDALLTSVVSFGEQIHYQTKEPTFDLDAIRAAIDAIPVDESGTENMCRSIADVLQKHRSFFTRAKYRLAVVVLSDESGEDGEYVEDALKAAKNSQSPIYILGRESVFGSPDARIRWTDPETGFGYWRPIRRGPETAFVEQLQTDGFQQRYRLHTSGFGPYEQARLAGQTGGIMFILPHEEANLVEADNRRYEFLDMKEYVPTLLERSEYQRTRAASPLRTAIWEVIEMLKPGNAAQPGNVSVPLHFPIEPAAFQAPALAAENKALHVAGILQNAHDRLQKVSHLRAHEPSRRWRANYDLILGQVMAYRVRMFEYARHLNHFRREMPTPTKENSNHWDLATAPELIPADETLEIARVTEAELLEVVAQSTAQLQSVVEQHPRTPWAARAEWELSRGFSVRLSEAFHDPRIQQRAAEIKLPNL